MNRHVWRGLLGLDDGPCTDFNTFLQVPLPENATSNVLASVEGLDPQQKIAFLATFLRFVLEMAQQISEVLVTERADVVPDEELENDYNMLMQMHIAAKTARDVFKGVQAALDHSFLASEYVADVLLRRIRTRYLGMPADMIPSEIHEFMAMLVVYAGEDNVTTNQLDDTTSKEWLTHWWSKILPVLRSLDNRAGLSTMDEAHEDVVQSTEIVDLDTQVANASDEEAGAQATADQEEEDEIMTEVQKFQDEIEDADLLAAVERFEQEERARELQRSEDECLRSAMARPARTTPRLQIDICVRGPGQSSSSTAQFHTAVPENSQPLEVSMTMKVVESKLPDTTEGDEVGFMQKGNAYQKTHLDRNIRIIRRCLGLFHPELRSTILRGLRALLQGRLHIHLRQARSLLQLLDTDLFGDEGTTLLDETHNQLIAMIFSDLNLADADGTQEIGDDHIEALINEIGEFATKEDEEDISPRRRSASSSWQHIAVRGSTANSTSVAEDIQTSTNHFLDRLDIADREQARREMVKRLIEHMQCLSARTRSLLLLLSGFLPQPDEQGKAAHHVQLGKEISDHIMTALQLAYHYEVNDSLSTAPFGVLEVTRLLPGLGNFAVEIMGFLENGEYDLDNLTSNDEEVPKLADSRPAKGRTRETQSTTAPPSGSPSSSSRRGLRVPQSPILLPPHAPRVCHRDVCEAEGEERGVQRHPHQGEEPRQGREDDSDVREGPGQGKVDLQQGQSEGKGRKSQHKGSDTRSRGKKGRRETSKDSVRGGEKRKGPDEEGGGDGGTGSAAGIRRFLSG